MSTLVEENKIAFLTCIESVLIRHGVPNYNSVIDKIRSQYECEMSECVDHPDYLKAVIKEVYKNDYDAILGEISMETERLEDVDEIKAEFFQIYEELIHQPKKTESIIGMIPHCPTNFDSIFT